MTQQPDYKTLPGGSIDYAHYIRQGHEIRSVAAHAGLARIARTLRAIIRLPGKAGDSMPGSIAMPAE